MERICQSLAARAIVPRPNPVRALAFECAALCGEPSNWRYYCGVVNRLGFNATRRIMSEVRQGNARSSAALFTYLARIEYAERRKKL